MEWHTRFEGQGGGRVAQRVRSDTSRYSSLPSGFRDSVSGGVAVEAFPTGSEKDRPTSPAVEPLGEYLGHERRNGDGPELSAFSVNTSDGVASLALEVGYVEGESLRDPKAEEEKSYREGVGELAVRR
jgi:hypothetical protein